MEDVGHAQKGSMDNFKTIRPDKKAVWSWVFYDFANSVYATLVITFIYATYFVKAVAPDEITGTMLWSRGVTITAIVVAALSPVLGAIADQAGYRKKFLFISTVITVIASGLLYFAQPGQMIKALTWFVISNIAFELANVFYNAFLPDIAPREKIGSLSGIGWGMGYVGGLLAMSFAMIAFINPETPWFGFTKEAGENIRATTLLTAAWFALFSIPIFLFVKQPLEKNNSPVKDIVPNAFSDIRATFKDIKKYRQIVIFLLARLIYNDGLVTIFAFGGIYAAGTFDFSFSDIMIFGIVINIAAGIGALSMGFFDDKFGGKKTIQVSNVILALAVLLAVIAPDRQWFWVAAVTIGFFSGPNQAASRSLLSRFIPKSKENQFFGFFAFSGKLTAFMGPMLLGILTDMFNSQRAGISVVILFFIAGGLVLHQVDENAGIRDADQR